MNRRRQVIRLYVALYAAYHVHSFQLQSHPHRLLTKCNVGYQYPQNWSDIKPNNNEQTKEQSIVSSLSKKRPLSPHSLHCTHVRLLAIIFTSNICTN